MIIEGSKFSYEVVVGLEVHVQLGVQSKLFSTSPSSFGDIPNQNVSVVDIALPGVLPRLNMPAVLCAIRAGFGLNAVINTRSSFDRKHYFYPDLPQGYQISQFYHPIVQGGFVEVDLEDGSVKKVGVERAHLEQDAGKLLHDLHPSFSCLDLNRAGVPLLEIVSAPDIRSPQEAMEYVKNLRAIIRALHVSDGDMEKGSMRCDVNVSVRPMGEDALGTRCEVKNVNSIKFIGKAIRHEAARQVELIECGGAVVQQTRLFDATFGVTRPMREKEEAADYRYLPDSDLPEVVLTQDQIEEVRLALPELPRDKCLRYVSEYGLSDYDARVLSGDTDVAGYYEDVVRLSGRPKIACNWITVEMFGRLQDDMKFEDLGVTPEDLSELIGLIDSGEISGKIAKEVLDALIAKEGAVLSIVEKRGMRQVSDKSAILSVIQDVLRENSDKVETYKGGKDRLFGFFVGETMKRTSGKANPKVVNEILHRELSK